MVGSLEDCWPDVDDGYVETLLTLRPQKDYPRDQGGGSIESARRPEQKSELSRLGLTESAARVLDKLERQDRWGVNKVSFDTLRNHYCRNIADIDKVLEILCQQQLLLSHEGRRGPFSLNPAKKSEVEMIVKEVRLASASA